jgi:hypothetical protein
VPRDVLPAGSVIGRWTSWEVCNASGGCDEVSGTKGCSLGGTPSSDDPVETVTTAGIGAGEVVTKASD